MNLIRAILNSRWFKPYTVICNYGTAIPIRDIADGIDWLRYCGPNAGIYCRKTGAPIAHRHF